MDTKNVNSPGAGQIPAAQANRSQAARKADEAGAKDQSPIAKAGKGERDWQVDLSPKAKEMAEARAKALDIARSTPEVREDRVAELKKRINEGSYQVDAGNIADGMLREAVRDRLAQE